MSYQGPGGNSTPNPPRSARITSKTLQLVAWLRRPLAWIGGHELSALAAPLALVLAALAFAWLADEVFEGDTETFDQWAVRAMRHADDPTQPIGPEWMHEVGRDLTALGGVAVLALLAAAVVGYLALRRVYHAMWLVLAATLGGLAVGSLFKWLFARERPEIVPHLSHVATSSFPSGHSMMAAVVYLTLGTLLARLVESRVLKAYFLLIALLLTLLVGVSRVYMGVHYPTDVLAGWAAGLAWALACWLAARYLQNRGAVEPNVEAATAPGED